MYRRSTDVMPADVRSRSAGSQENCRHKCSWRQITGTTRLCFPLLLQVVILALLCTSINAAACDVSTEDAGLSESQRNESAECCSLQCPSGFGVPDNCTSSSVDEDSTEDDSSASRECVPCQPGLTFSPSASVGEHCRPCSVCSAKAHVVRECNTTHDTVCECEKGYYMSAAENQCKPCSPCPHGWGVWRLCSAANNTVCRKCPPGTYSGVLSGTLGCVLCSSCREDQIMLQECSIIQDTVCVDRSLQGRHHFQSSKPKTDDDSEVVSYSESNALPVFFTMLVMLAVGLVVCFVLHWRLRKVGKTHVLSVSAGSPVKNCDYSPLPRQPLVSGTTPVVNSFVRGVANIPLAPQLKGRVSGLGTAKRREMEAKLNAYRQDGRDWRGLAKELGYASSSISAFECLGKDRHGPMRHLLADWSKTDNATVDNLLQALLRLGRLDVVLLLEPNCLKRLPHVQPGCLV